MYDLHNVEFLKFHGIPTWMKATPLVLTLAVATPLFSQTLSSGGGTTGTLSATASSELLTTRIVSQAAKEDQSAVPLPDIVEGSITRVEDLNNAEVTKVSTPTPVWESLSALSESDRANAQLGLESTKQSESVKNAESLWNSGDFDQAIDAIRSIEESGNAMAYGISWKTPKMVISPNWGDTDSQVGTRTGISDTHLDFDAQNGNLFTVIQHTGSDNVEWTVNLSSDGGKTWQETYVWTSAGTAIIDVSAAVVGNYLWVGYVDGTANDEARMRRINVSNGSVDSVYGYKVIFDKDRPIKEVVVFANADSYDNRVYYSAILNDYTSVLDSIIAQTNSATATAVDTASEVGQQTPIKMGSASQMLPQLATNAKIHQPNETLKNFNNGQTKTSVIINLVDPSSTSNTTNAVSADFSDINTRDAITQEIESVQNNVLNKMDKTQVNVTHTFKYIYGFSAEVTVEGLAALVNDPNVRSIEPDLILEAHGAQAIPQMNADVARSKYAGAGVSIAICDTGIDYTHPMLGNGGFPNSKVIGGYDTGDDDADPMDAQGHGTSVAGIAAGTLGNTGDYIGGVAHDAKLYAIKISTGTSGSASTAAMIAGWEWAIDHQNDDAANPIRIINTSFGGGYYTSESSCDSSSPAMATAAANAKAAGITLFVSSGNDGYCDGTSWPGCLSDVVGVGAVYDANIGAPGWCVSADSCVATPNSGCTSGYAAFESSTAMDQVTLYSNTASFVEIFAPSNNAYTTALGGGYTSGFGGTSAASPYAAGAGALLQSAHFAKTGSYLTPDQLQAALIDTGDAITDGKVAITKPRVNVGNIVDAIDNLIFDWARDIDTASPIWVEDNPGIGNALSGLDATSINTTYTNWWAYLSYIATNGSKTPVMVLRHSDSAWEPIEVLSDYTGSSTAKASISAYGDTVITVYEHQFDARGVRYNISYDSGDNWLYGTFEAPTGESFFQPDVTARGSQGIGITYSHEAGNFDPVWYQVRNGYPYAPWNALQINEHDTLTGTPNTIEWLPSSAENNHGVIYLDSNRAAYFDKAVEEKNTDFLPAVYYLLFN